jgi:Tol biopolymer transport system component
MIKSIFDYMMKEKLYKNRKVMLTLIIFLFVISTLILYPAQEKIAFSSDRDSHLHIFIMNPDGSEVINITQDSFYGWAPLWLPDGKTITYGTFEEAHLYIYSMHKDGSNKQKILDDSNTNWFPSWSPDGKRICFTSDRDGNDEVYIVNADGTNPVNITNNPASDIYSSWSPDGKRICFTSDRDGNNEVYIVNADGTNPVNITNNPASDVYPSWSSRPKKFSDVIPFCKEYFPTIILIVILIGILIFAGIKYKDKGSENSENQMDEDIHTISEEDIELE